MRQEPSRVPTLSRGSVVVFALFACLVACVAVQMLVAAVVCGHRAIGDEKVGRDLLLVKDECLAGLKDLAFRDWRTTEWRSVGEEDGTVSARLAGGVGGSEWVLHAEVKEVLGSSVAMTSALVERGRDGLDLPSAALVADRVLLDSGRNAPWTTVQSETVPAYVRMVLGEAPTGEGCLLQTLDSPWGLGDGWRKSLRTLGDTEPEHCLIVVGEPGEQVRAPDDVKVSSSEEPLLLITMGGADLDLRDMGDLWVVVVVDEGSLAMEGTVVRGAVCVSRDVDMGSAGEVVYEERVLQWARDRSFTRARLVPGSRREVTQ